MKEITVICPIYNEEKNIKIFFERFLEVFKKINNYKFVILFADNHSTDNSSAIIKNICKRSRRVKYIRYSINNGVMKSIYTAINLVKSDACAVFDCDLQDSPSLLIQFIKNWEKNYKIVFGKRIIRKENIFLSILRSIFKRLNFLSKGYNIEIESGAWFLDKSVIKELKNRKFDPFLPALIDRLSFKKKGIPYKRIGRVSGDSKFNFFSYISYATEGLISGTIKPLKLSVYFSFFFGLFSFLSAIYFILAKFYFKIYFAEGIAAIVIINLTSFALLFLFLSILGEYVGQMYLSDENQKLAVIEQKLNM
jgi:glycosyltransferase involved in cell wall biosynthesis